MHADDEAAYDVRRPLAGASADARGVWPLTRAQAPARSRATARCALALSMSFFNACVEALGASALEGGTTFDFSGLNVRSIRSLSIASRGMDTALGMTKYALVRAYVPHLRDEGWGVLAGGDRRLGLPILASMSREVYDSGYLRMLVPYTVNDVPWKVIIPHEFLTSYNRNNPFKPRLWPASPISPATTTTERAARSMSFAACLEALGSSTAEGGKEFDFSGLDVHSVLNMCIASRGTEMAMRRVKVQDLERM